MNRPRPRPGERRQHRQNDAAMCGEQVCLCACLVVPVLSEPGCEPAHHRGGRARQGVGIRCRTQMHAIGTSGPPFVSS